jgi:uncharacterized protein (DUF2252 family)
LYDRRATRLSRALSTVTASARGDHRTARLGGFMSLGSHASRHLAIAIAVTLVAGVARPAAASRSRTAEVVAVITAANAGLSAADRAEKYALMKASPTAFFRGANVLYWKDVGASAQLALYGGLTTTRTFLAGDQHVDNFGAFDDDQGDVVYAINDFDEAVIGDYQLDLWRAAVSVVLVARGNGGFSAANQATLLDAFTEAYLDAMASYAGAGTEVTRKFLASNTYGLLDDFLRDAASGNSRVKLLDGWTVKIGGVRRLDVAGNADLAPVSAAVEADVRDHIAAYRATLSGGTVFPASTFTVKSVALRLHAGLASLGATRYYVLIEGATVGHDDDRILDIKVHGAPTAAPYLSPAALAQTTAVSGGNHAVRTTQAYKALGYRVDDLLGTMTLSDNRTYSVRERSPFKATLDVTTLTSMTRLQNLAEQWGTALATQHARADRDWDPTVFPSSLDGEIDLLTNGDHAGFRALVRAIAIDYADQVTLDYASFLASF